MSQEMLTKIVERLSTDASYREQLASNPEAALKGYDLTAEERAALMSGDSAKLESMGVDARLSKFGGSSFFDSENANPFAAGSTD